MNTNPARSASRGNLVADLIAGMTTGVANIPDAMASAILAGANPVQGLYAIMVGTPLGTLFGSSAFMNVSATSALAITAGAALTGYASDADAHARAMATLAVVTGLVMLLVGVLKFGRLLRFVSNSVVIGFLPASPSTSSSRSWATSRGTLAHTATRPSRPSTRCSI